MKKTSVITSLIAALCLVFQATAFAQSTNPIIYSCSTNLNIPSNGAPVLQYVLQDNYLGVGRILVQCYSNSIYQLQESTNVTGPWTYVQEVFNNSVYTFYTTNSPSLFFRLEAVTNRFYVTMLPAPDGTPPIGVMVYPEWDVTYGYYFSVTNTSPSNLAFTFCALGDELLVPVYPDRLTNTMTAWECAYITEYYLNSSGVLASSVVDVVMPAGCHYLTFEPNFMFGFADPGQPTPHMVECGGTFPNLYLGTFGCNPGVPVNSPYPGSPNNIIGNGSGGNVPPINDGPTYVPPGPNPITMNPSPQNVNNITGPGDYPVQYPGQSPTSPNQNAFPSMIYPSSPGPMSIPPTPPELDPSPNPNTPPANAPCIFEQLYHWGTGM